MALFSGDIDNLRELYETQLRFLLSAEDQIATALPKMIEAATDVSLKHALQAHLRETEVQAERVKKILTDLSHSDSDKKCAVTAALIAAGQTTIAAANDDAVRDVGIIAAAQKIEHFEIASYGSAREWANLLGETQQAALLEQTLQEEIHADKALTTVAEHRNLEAAHA